jgi:hypothetical protein
MCFNVAKSRWCERERERRKVDDMLVCQGLPSNRCRMHVLLWAVSAACFSLSVSALPMFSIESGCSSVTEQNGCISTGASYGNNEGCFIRPQVDMELRVDRFSTAGSGDWFAGDCVNSLCRWYVTSVDVIKLHQSIPVRQYSNCVSASGCQLTRLRLNFLHPASRAA